VLVSAQGQYVTGYWKDYRDKEKYEVIEKDGQPYFVREKHDDFDWPQHVKIHHTYGGKVIIENTSSQETALTQELKIKLANLALKFGSVGVSGFLA
jgi:hypothetical protein